MTYISGETGDSTREHVQCDLIELKYYIYIYMCIIVCHNLLTRFSGRTLQLVDTGRPPEIKPFGDSYS